MIVNIHVNFIETSRAAKTRKYKRAAVNGDYEPVPRISFFLETKIQIANALVRAYSDPLLRNAKYRHFAFTDAMATESRISRSPIDYRELQYGNYTITTIYGSRPEWRDLLRFIADTCEIAYGILRHTVNGKEGILRAHIKLMWSA